MTDLKNGLKFTVDAGIINKLGKELVGRAETAVSELVKNAYDADANNVAINFIETDREGGSLIIRDDGNGMDLEQVINGFMRLSSSDKLHHPRSPVFNRQRAGRKGIGRFATQRLGDKLTILTKVKSQSTALRLEVDWNKYQNDIELESIYNPISEVEVDFEKGTELVVSLLRESWTEASIKKVFRFVSDLLQPAYLSDRTAGLNIAKDKSDDYFNVNFIKTADGQSYPIANLDKLYFDNALGVIEGYVINGIGVCEVKSERFKVNDIIDIAGTFNSLNEIHFKVYYFIYNYDWYEGFLPKMDYNRLVDLSAENSGVKLYRNGFRVLPYGEKGNDWINIEKTSLKTTEQAYVPFSNSNFFGFVEVIDPNGIQFEETSSREGLIENSAFSELVDFLHSSLSLAARRINSARIKEKNTKNDEKPNDNEDNTEPNEDGEPTDDQRSSRVCKLNCVSE